MEKSTYLPEKEVLINSKTNKESIYYVCLFGLGFIASMVLLIYAIVKSNQALIIYSSILTPVFVIATLAATRFAIASTNPVFIKNDELFIKSFLRTLRIKRSDIDKITVATFTDSHKTSVNITYGGKNTKYTFENISKETAAKLRKINKL